MEDDSLTSPPDVIVDLTDAAQELAPGDHVLAAHELPEALPNRSRRRLGSRGAAVALIFSLFFHSSLLFGAIYYFARHGVIGNHPGNSGGDAGVSPGALVDSHLPADDAQSRNQSWLASPQHEPTLDERASQSETLPNVSATATDDPAEDVGVIALGPGSPHDLLTPQTHSSAAATTHASAGNPAPATPQASAPPPGNGGRGFGDAGNGAGGGGEIDGQLALFTPRPDYPELAKRRRWEGTVSLHIQTDGKGHPIRVDITQSSGYDLLDQAAVAKARADWRFPPGTIDINTGVKFQLRDAR